MSSRAERAGAAISRLRLGKGRSEAQLLFADGSLLHMRHDKHSRWLQDGAGGMAAELHGFVTSFELRRGWVRLCFDDGSALEVGYRLRRLLVRTTPPKG